ncbi:NADH dehydrogenase [Halomonas cupida]|uniref:NADH dehydrogenase n=1 Tax=Halomonas cupida TaxID=44933 RepID=A0A1M7ERQ2_9GAMM|nr:FAD-dependent oxidoreductase [Halomonas cupida]GEN23234.1 NADH dehydrogenase [Halomonas cupida]SHL94515.1 NADH dehydrogenase [Halomonas cupida]
MTQRIIIAGSGFAGLWAAMSAARAVYTLDKDPMASDIEIIMVSPEPKVCIRPRLYEAVLENMDPDIGPLLQEVGVKHLPGFIEAIDTYKKSITVLKHGEENVTLPYDRLVLATGSELFHPPVPGLAKYTFSVNTLSDARKLHEHLQALASQSRSQARDTIVVVGGGLTGLETATEMPTRLRHILGPEAEARVVIVDTADQIGIDMGIEPATLIAQALSDCGVEARAGVRVEEVDECGVRLSNGEHIKAHTVIWAAGMRASSLTAQIPGERDSLGRILGDEFLHAPGVKGVFVTGDTVKVPTDNQGNYNVMSCQHAMSLGRVAGHNAAAELLGLPLHPYSQPKYVTCLDLGPWGALYTEGWDRQVHYIRNEGKKIKQEINTVWIYPPEPDREAVFSVANPDFVVVP